MHIKKKKNCFKNQLLRLQNKLKWNKTKKKQIVWFQSQVKAHNNVSSVKMVQENKN